LRFVSKFAHVNRPQPEAPQCGLQERAKSFEAVDAGLSHERDVEGGRALQDDAGGEVVAVGKLAWRPGGGVKRRSCVRQNPWPCASSLVRGAVFF